MGTLKITKKHHKHINNPFPSTPRSLPFIQGPIFFDSETLPSHDKILPIGNDFQLLWSSNNGGYLSISHLSQPTRPIWSTIPGQAFVSAALAKTEIEESRGSFVFKDRDVHSVCDHQTIEDIRVINQIDSLFYDKDLDSSSGYVGLDQKTDLKDTQFPALLVTGWIFSNKRKRRLQSCGIYKDKQFSIKGNPVSASARYCLLFDQKTSNQIRFRLKLCEQTSSYINPNGLSRNQHPCRKLRLRRKIKFGYDWCGFFTKARGFLKISSSEEEIGAAESGELKINRVFLTYSSEENERFYGFGEQFSHMDFKGKRVPIFVQEQGIGRGDQPITFAANLVSYRAAGDWSTTYAPSPFYMTSKMRSLYLEGYEYSVFDLTRRDRVQIQIHGDSIEGRILQGNSPCELIECFTETIGRLPELPEWITSGAVVGMQGGTDAVRRIWDLLRTHDVPVSAFWLQVMQVPIIRYQRSEELLLRWMELNAFTTVFRTHEGNKPTSNSQFYSNQQTLSHFARFAKVYRAWKFYRIQLVKEAAEKGLPLCRHLFLHYPDDERVHTLSYHQFLVGTEILVVPVLDKGKKKVRAYFPIGEMSSWQHIWTGMIFKNQGSEAWVDAPIGYPAVFVKTGSVVGETFLKNLKESHIL